MKEFVFINGKIVTPQEVFEGYVVVRDGKIAEVARGDYVGGAALVDLAGKHLLPGLIDVHVHFRTPGGTQKEDWTTGSKAALAGGVTTVLDMPNTNPSTTDAAALEMKRALVEKAALVNYGFFAGATKENLEELRAMKGVAGIKVYMGSSTGNLLVDDLVTLEELMKDSGGKILALHAENEQCIRLGAQQHEGENDPAVHSKIRAPECAAQAVEAALKLVEKYHARVHFCHVSTTAEVELIRAFKKNHAGKVADLVTAEVTPHHLFLSEKDYATLGNLVKVNPPLRSWENLNSLWEALMDGTINMIATDHAPHLLAEKQLPYADAPSGVPGVQTILPLLLDAAHKAVAYGGKFALQNIAQLCAENPARRFGMTSKGQIAAGFDADFAIVDFARVEKITNEKIFSKCGWTPFAGREITGWPVQTFVGGELMYEVGADGSGKFGKNLGRELQ